VDVTPMMNVFVILIPFLVSMAVFTQLSIVRFTVPPNVDNPTVTQSDQSPKPRVTIELQQQFATITLADSLFDSLAVGGDPLDVAAFRPGLSNARRAAEDNEQVIIAPASTIAVQSIITAIDAAREVGFSSYALSSTFRQIEGPQESAE